MVYASQFKCKPANKRKIHSISKKDIFQINHYMRSVFNMQSNPSLWAYSIFEHFSMQKNTRKKNQQQQQPWNLQCFGIRSKTECLQIVIDIQNPCHDMNDVVPSKTAIHFIKWYLVIVWLKIESKNFMLTWKTIINRRFHMPYTHTHHSCYIYILFNYKP